jgi:alkyl hydroperoxide reductase subunit AhpC
MAELVQLDRRHEDFARRNTRVIVVSVEGQAEAKLTQNDFKNLLVLDDAGRGLTDAAALIHAHAGPGGSDIAMPTTILVDRTGTVRWLFRPDAVITRLRRQVLVDG